MRIMRRAFSLGVLLAASLTISNGALRADDAPVVHVKAMVKDGGVRLEAQANAPFEYTSYRLSEDLYVVDMTGVASGDGAGAKILSSDLVKSYRVVTYTSGQKPVVRLELLMSKDVQPRFERTDSQELTLVVAPEANDANTSAPAAQVKPVTATAPILLPVAAKSVDEKNPASASQSIQDVNLAQNGDLTDVRVLGSGPLTYHATLLENPNRLVLDFDSARLKTSVNHIASNLNPVKEIRVAQYSPEVSRVVIDLRSPSAYDVNTTGNTVTVSFSSKSIPSAASNPMPAPAAGNLTTTKSKKVTSAKIETASVKQNQVTAPAAMLPASMTRSSDSLASPASAVSVPAASASVAVETPAQPAMAAPARAAVVVPVSTPAPAPAPVVPARAQAAPTPAAATGYSGEPISVNLKDVDLRDFFRLIHEISGLNVVVDPNVKGSLTIVLDDVPWDQALDIVLHNNDLDKQLDGNVLRIATKETVRREADESRDLARAQAEAADIVTTTRVLSYAKASALAATLKKFLSSRGDILADDRSNTMIIRDIPSSFPVIDNLLRQLDRKSQQVEIEARVVAANRSFSREIGTQFGAAFGAATANNANLVSGVTGVGTSPVIRNFPPLPAPPVIVGSGGTGVTSGSIPLNTNLGVSAPTSGFGYSFSSANFALDMIITAAEDRGVGKLLSKPKVITQNNEKATVKQGTKIPVQTVVNNTVSVQFVDAVLELDVTPQITAEGTVYMDVTVENDQIDASIPRVQGIPAIDTQSAETKVTVIDGATVVIGGIIVTQQRTDIQQVPVVGSLPLLGNLFKHTTVSSSSQELLFFLTPRILPG